MKKLFIIGIAALLLVAFTMPAMAKVKIGGIVFTDIYYLDRDSQNNEFWNGSSAVHGDSYTNTRIDVPVITRLYGRWTNEDNVGMYIEFGIGGGGGATDVVLRHAYGWWDITPNFQLMAGHSTTPFSPLNPSQLLGTNDGSLNIIGVGYGDFYSGRYPQVRGTFKFGKMGRVEVALVDPNGGGDPWSSNTTTTNPGATYETNTKIPRIDVGVPLYFGPVSIYPGIVYQHRTVDIAPNTTTIGGGAPVTEDNVDTFIGSLAFKLGFGPFGFAAEGNYGSNWGNTRGLFGAGGNPAVALSSAVQKDNGQINDADTYSFWFDLWYKFGPITPHIMYGQMKSKSETAAGMKTEAKTQMWGFSIPIDLAKGFRLRPEFMWYDDGDTSTDGPTPTEDHGKYAVYGVQFQITF